MSDLTTPDVDNTLRMTPLDEFEPSAGYGPCVSSGSATQDPELELELLELEEDDDEEEDEEELDDEELELVPPEELPPPPPQAAARAPTPERPIRPRTLRRPRI